MSTVEVLAPLRIETRFVAPADRDDGVDQWMLRVRVYPDEFSMRPVVAPPAPAELDRLTEALEAMDPPRSLDENDAFAMFAASVGAARAFTLWRECVAVDAAGARSVDRSRQAEAAPLQVHGPAGLPGTLEIWLIHADGTRRAGATLTPDTAAIGADLDLAAFAAADDLVDGKLPPTWWLSYQRACDVGLGVDLDLGPTVPALEALVVVGTGDDDAAPLVEAHNGAGRLAVLAPGTPTNTVEGEATTEFGDDAESYLPLLDVDPHAQGATVWVFNALAGGVPPGALPLLGGDLDLYAPGSLAVQAFWPVLWGRALRDVMTTDGVEVELARWAISNLAVEGPRPSVRIGHQPYGLLPASTFAAWVADPDDPLGPLEERIREWGLAWRAGAAAAAEQANAWLDGADTGALLEVLGLHAPNRHWEVRPVADLILVQVERALAGLEPFTATEWDVDTARAWRRLPWPAFPIAPAARRGAIPGPPGDAVEDPARLKALITMDPEPLVAVEQTDLGLVGHLFRETMIAVRAIVGRALLQWTSEGAIDLAAPLPLDDEVTYRQYVMRGTDRAAQELETNTDANGLTVATRFRDVREALTVIADLWDGMHDDLFRATLAALDTAAFRVDPWLTGIAERRLQRMIGDGAPFKLGAYGWVDAPEPFGAGTPDALAPGPTAAGLLHAPSRDQALVAALLRDAAVRYPDDGRWRLEIDSARVRASIALAERVRLGVHPYEALGLEVEAVAGDWDVVRVLREQFPLLADQDARRVCDGAKVLQAARDAALPAGLPADLATRLEPLDDVLDTYADLLVADGVHALVTGRADLANAAMEAAAGLGAPPELRSIDTPRAATTVRVSAWALLPPGVPGAVDAGTPPVDVADPAFAALVDAELGVGARVSADPAVVAARQRLAQVVGGGEDEGPVPALTGGAYEGVPATSDDDLHAALVTDLDARFDRLRRLAAVARDAVAAMDPGDPATADRVGVLASRWGFDLAAVAPGDPVAMAPTTADLRDALAAELTARLGDAAGAVPAGPAPKTDAAVNVWRRAIRVLAGDRTVPVLPVVARALLPTLRPAAELDREWLEVVAAVRPRLAPLEAHQLDSGHASWAGVVAAPDGSTDPWHAAGPVLAAYVEPGAGAGAEVAVAALDGWTDSVPSRRHVTFASFGFNAPKSRAPQAILLAVPPDPEVRLDNGGLLDVVLETRELAHARATRPGDRNGLPYATPQPLVHAAHPVSFLEGWPK